jgi:hypothetical protein
VKHWSEKHYNYKPFLIEPWWLIYIIKRIDINW